MNNTLIKVTKAGTGKRTTMSLLDIQRIEEDEIKVDGEMKDCVTIWYGGADWVKVNEDFDTLFNALKQFKDGVQ